MVSRAAQPAPARDAGSEPISWADPGYFSSDRTRQRGPWQLLWSLIIPPAGNTWRLTMAGYMLIALSAALLMAAYNTASNILFMALSLLASAFIMGGVLQVTNFRRIAWRLQPPASLRAGETSTFTLEVRNEKRLLPSFSLSFLLKASRADVSERVHLREAIEPGATRVLTWQFTPPERGHEFIEVVGIESEYPFGFMRRRIAGSTRRKVLVWPPRMDYSLPARIGRLGRPGNFSQRRLGDGADLRSIRHYQPGDPPRLVHWKASARLQRMVVRQHEEESQDGFVIFVETAKYLWHEGEQFERLCATAASLAEDLFREGRLQAFAFNGEPATAVQRLADVHEFFDRLATAELIDHYQAMRDPARTNVLTFKPDGKRGILICVAGEPVGAAAP